MTLIDALQTVSLRCRQPRPSISTGSALLIPALLAGASASAAPVPGPAWADHMVIQRDAPIVIEGTANAGEAVAGSVGTDRATATADAAGHFALHFAAHAASATPVPIEITAGQGTAPIVLHDVLIGDVWLCSGQSNMEYPLTRALDGPSVAEGSADAGLRLLTIAKATSTVPKADFPTAVNWQAAAPASVSPFSAACYFMARELRKTSRVPIGAIHASWGGSQIRPWLAPATGVALYGSADMALLRQFPGDPLGAVAAFAPRWADWYAGGTGGSRPWLAPDTLAWHPVPKIGYWNDWTGTPLASHATGTVWLRRQVTLNAAQVRAGGTLNLGILDDMDMTWVNGHAVGNSFGWDYERRYRVPPSYLHAGANEIMVAITNSYGTGGFTSPADHLQWAVEGGTPLSLATDWRYAIAPVSSYPPRAPWDSNGGIGVMYNAMIAPFGHFALKGVAWYQGESDDGIPGYEARLRGLIQGWRGQFGSSAQMLVVQLANFGAPQLAPTESGWATVREDQRLASVAEPDTALVTAIDLGEAENIHPANKASLGHRLALAAQGVALPVPISARREGSAIRVVFAGIEGGLAAWSAAAPIGFELCGAGQSSCRYAPARIEGTSVVLSDDGRPVTRVRHGWAGNPLINTRDARGIPLPGFELSVGP
ncbi:sialate O-acetylesterase [Novosphingobium sp.]|uniref:sialate O-acetylesterase n=1 Tax=Novosphingobium sp. TaxID=1874826 RepID=UPI003B52FFCA